jgi:hypothetical protein
MTISTQTFLAVVTGASANDGTGDSLRAAFTKLNANFGYMGNVGFDAKNINATGAVEVAGNVAFAGAIVNSGYQLYQPTANIAVTANVNVSRVILAPTPSGGIVSFFADVTLPNTTVDGTIVSISSNVAVQFMRALPGWGIYTVSPSANIALTAGDSASYLLNTVTSKWYKVG